MRLLIATGIYPPDIGGPATYAAQLFEHLPKRGIEVSIVTYADKIPMTKNGGCLPIYVSRMLPKGIRHLLYFFKVLWYGRKADIIYALDMVSAGLPAAVAAKILRKPFMVKMVGDYAWEQQQIKNQEFATKLKVLGSPAHSARGSRAKRSLSFVASPAHSVLGSRSKTEVLLQLSDGASATEAGIRNHGDDTIEEFQKRRYGVITEVRRSVQNLVVRSARVVVTPSGYLKNIIAGWGITREKISVVPNAVIVPNVLPSREEARARLGLSGIVLLSAGRLVPWKGFRTLIQVASELKQEIPGVHLLIIGSGPEEAALKTYTHSHALEEQVRFIGSVSHDTLWSYLRASDIFLLNTAYEGFSHQLIEAMAAGVPVITTAIGGNPEIVENGKEGFLVPYDDAETLQERILSLLADKKKYAEIKEQAKERVGQFSLERMIERTIRVFQSLISKS